MTPQTSSLEVSLQHHGASASSLSQAVTWLPSSSSSNQRESTSNQPESTDSSDDDTLVYASHAVVNLCRPQSVKLANGRTESVWQVQRTLRSRLQEGNLAFMITALAHVQQRRATTTATATTNEDTLSTMLPPPTALTTAFSDGSLSLWLLSNKEDAWKEFVLARGGLEGQKTRSITAVDACWISPTKLAIVTASSAGASYYECEVAADDLAVRAFASRSLWASTAVKTVSLRGNDDTLGLLVLLGTAAPRHNRIHVFHRTRIDTSTNENETLGLHYVGGLSGHEDWITCMDWSPATEQSVVLASGSQDARIRLWRFVTTKEDAILPEGSAPVAILMEDIDNEEEGVLDKQAEEEEEEGEARMEIWQSGGLVTRVTLEALLMGHEEMVTDVSWHPSPKITYGEDLLLISSSMDRSIFLWTAGEDGIWTPLSRVGSAGGILGGSVGSTLLGYLAASLNPSTGRCLVGHAYGGSLHVWHIDDTALRATKASSAESMAAEDRAAMVQWRAQPCVTGHFGGVVDLSWEASGGDYVLSVSSDQTCRLWASVQAVSEDSRQVWLELGRPQVHGYDLAAVTSISTKEHPHLMVTGADEKELRAFDAPTATLQLLQQVFGLAQDADSIARVDRAYIPSLGLSNKASAKDSAEEEKPNESENNIKENRLRLPFERDLGAVSLWPETRKLFGHTTELYCLTSTVAAQTARAFAGAAPLEVIVASSCKARDADAAAIRLWKVHEGKCHQVLSGGHKATVATLAFSPCGTYLASSGKDRRLCVWKRQPEGNFVLAWFRDNAHKRIIWSVHFCPWDPLCLVSGSRDGCIRVWRLSETEGTLQATVAHSFAPSFSMNGKPDAVTALSLRPTPYAEGVALLAVGLESGRSEFWSLPVAQVTPNDGVPALVRAVPEGLCHRATITKLAWKPEDEAQGGSTLLASSSMDHGVRVLQVTSV